MEAKKDKKKKAAAKPEKAKGTLTYASLLPAKPRKAKKGSSALDWSGVLQQRREERTRLGRGRSSGKGKTSGRGQKGQKSRAGYSRRAGFEGGQLPIHRRLPKRGFTNIFKKDYQVVNVLNLSKAGLSGEVGPVEFVKAGLIADAQKLVKILGNGELKAGLKITADAISGPALQKVEAAGGSFTKRVLKKAKKEKAAAK